ncbi:hypothetical protein CspHIS471_0605460 [Cutaneotrichosporon sp. HIS471]|nr:hypothetical protein CspHIS471_0605460 [Cutaneotrichosporon sp. HIS471]
MGACYEHVKECWAQSIMGNHDDNVFGNSVEVVSARPGRAELKMKVQERHLNGHGNVHGGVVMTLVDDVTWLGMQTLGLPKVRSVSTNISCEFVRPSGRLGDDLYMVSEPVKIGRRLGFLRITFYDMKGQVCAYGTQTVAIDAEQEPFTHKFSADGSELLKVSKEKGDILPSTEDKPKL